MAASMFAQACDALVRERDRAFLERIAADYNLDFEELSAKYLESSETALKVPRKYTKKAKEVTVVTEPKPKTPKEPKAKAEKTCCTAQTSKKEPCKFAALKGEVFCLRHLKQANGDPAPKGPKPDKKKAKTDPVHTHPIDQKPAEPCETCEKYGEPLAPPPTEFEKVVTPKTAAERLAEMLAEADQGDSDQETDSGDLVEAEEFEEDE
jgi:hypothetical protein